MQIRWASPSLGEEEEREVLDSLRAGWVTMGPKVKAFEAEVARYLGVRHGIALNSGTAALDVAMKAMGIGPGDEVIVPDLTYIATVNAVAYQGATPVLVDVDPTNLNIEPEKVRSSITKKTKLIVPIDYGGCSAEYDKLEIIAREAGVPILQDAAHSIGGSFNGRKLGSIGIGATFSFHTAKVMTSVEGGMFVTDDDDLAQKARVIRNQGEAPGKKYFHPVVGHNYRMSDLHGAVGLAQFRKLSWLLDRRREVVGWYHGYLGGHKSLQLPVERKGTVHPWFLFSVLFRDRAARDAAEKALASAGVETRICWPLAVHQQEAWENKYKGGPFPIATSAAQRVLSLPLHAELKKDDVELVSSTLLEAINGGNGNGNGSGNGHGSGGK
jgi:perosamine synthetase